jgi:acetyl-CoA carboxylase biotin carboxyl carrier protein
MTRLHARRAEVVATKLDQGGWRLGSPAPGLFRPTPFRGARSPRDLVGHLEVLGGTIELVLPANVSGWLEHGDAHDAARPHHVGYQDLLGFLFPVQQHDTATPEAAAQATGDARHTGPVFRSPTSGRYYGRPGPDKPPFMRPGDELTIGTTICLLEVMKTFHRVTYDGERARVRELLVADGADVSSGDPLLALEPI